MKECCATCRRRYKLTKFDYSKGLCEHTDMDVYVFMAFADEGQAVWMVGSNECFDLCECYVPKEE